MRNRADIYANETSPARLLVNRKLPVSTHVGVEMAFIVVAERISDAITMYAVPFLGHIAGILMRCSRTWKGILLSVHGMILFEEAL